jgi:Cellulase (glycosyl hydrolase family 5)
MSLSRYGPPQGPKRPLVLGGVLVALVLAVACSLLGPTAAGSAVVRLFELTPGARVGTLPSASTSVATATGGSDQPGVFLTAARGQFIYGGHSLQLNGSTFYPATVGGTAAWRKSSFSQYIDHVVQLAASAGQNLLRPTDYWDQTNTAQTWNDPTIWANMDYLVHAAAQHHMFVILDLSAFKWLLVSENQNPYNATNWTTFLDFVGARYRNAPSIAFYSIVGEPPPPTTTAASDQLVAFYRAVTDELYRADQGHHLITAGGFIHMEQETPTTPWWHQIYALPHNDVVAFKTYSQHDLNLMPTIAAYATQLNKPLADEEFGMPQYMGDAQYAGGSGGYNGLYTSRAQFYQTVYTQGTSLGVASFAFWNLGCQLGSQSYEVSPLTPAVWQVVASHGPGPVVPWTGSAPPC